VVRSRAPIHPPADRATTGSTRAGLGIDDQVGPVGVLAMARMRPVAGSMATIAPRSPRSSRIARRCSAGRATGQQVLFVVRIAPELAQQPTADAAVTDAEERGP
jgi:hypothetical protein